MVVRKSRSWYLGLPIIILAIILGLSGTAIGQFQNNLPRSAGTVISTELYSPWEHDSDGKARHNPQLALKSCLDLLNLKLGCNRGVTISYGNRFGDNWDILAFHGTQSRMIDMGKAELSDKNDAPYIAPYRALEPGEKRHIAVNTSGGDGADGKHGLNGDGTSARYSPRPKRESFANKPVAHQVSQRPKPKMGSYSRTPIIPFWKQGMATFMRFEFSRARSTATSSYASMK